MRCLPATWDDIVPEFLPEKLLDPFDGQPLSIRAVPEGLVIYSVGADRTDDGGKLEGRDCGVGFRLVHSMSVELPRRFLENRTP